jgi:hypothetical protein
VSSTIQKNALERKGKMRSGEKQKFVDRIVFECELKRIEVTASRARTEVLMKN